MLLSIIIPTLNEAPHIALLIESLRAMQNDAISLEIIVSDGGSRDATAKLARTAGAIVVEGAKGRGAQLNAGARVASGDALWFLHADAKPHPRSATHIARCLQNSAICGGNFRLRFAGGGWAANVFARIARQQRRMGIYYGDSGIWTRRAVFDSLGGFADWPLFEDYDFARRLESFAQRHTFRTDYASCALVASPRRFHKAPLRILAQWLLLQMLFSLGASPQRLAEFYHRGKM